MRTLLPLIVLAGCGTLAHIDPLPRTIDQQYATVVQVESVCGGVANTDSWGTGVVISENSVLTAAHVVFCPDIPTVRVYLPSGKSFQMEVVEDAAMFGDGTDVARLRTVGAYDRLNVHVPPPELTKPLLGDTLCIQTFDHGQRCGRFEPQDGKLWVQAPTYKGDSGAPVYEPNGGDLVGIAVGSTDEGWTHFIPLTAHWLSNT